MCFLYHYKLIIDFSKTNKQTKLKLILLLRCFTLVMHKEGTLNRQLKYVQDEQNPGKELHFFLCELKKKKAEFFVTDIINTEPNEKCKIN